MRAKLGSTLVMLVLAGAVAADPPKPGKPLDAGAALGLLGGGDPTASLAGTLRAHLLAAMPDPLLDDDHAWGRQKKGPAGRVKNDGQWYRVKIRPRNLRDTLVLDLRDAKALEGGRTTFTVFTSFDAGMELERQHWRLGLRLYSGSTRARFRLKLRLQVEVTLRTEGKGLLPDAVFRLRVTESDLSYDNLVVEHTAGVGGDAAEILGDAFLGTLRQWKPSLERNLLARANEAVVKAADTKEMRIGLSGLLGK